MGAFQDPDGRLIRFGVPGQADWTGILTATGKRVEIEIKSDKGRQTPKQRLFQLMIEAANGIYILARRPEDVLSVLDRAYGAAA